MTKRIEYEHLTASGGGGAMKKSESTTNPASSSSISSASHGAPPSLQSKLNQQSMKKSSSLRRSDDSCQLVRPSPSELVSQSASSASFSWPNLWTEHVTDSELLHAASIAPNMLRPTPLGVRPSMYNNSTIMAIKSGGGGNSNALPNVVHPLNNNSNQHSDDDEGPNRVKFVNATIEILQNQIRKEEAPKKKRTRTTPDQLRILQKAFITDPMPNSSARLTLAKKLGMNARAVQVWFQNRRAKEKLEAKRAEVGRDRSMSADACMGSSLIGTNNGAACYGGNSTTASSSMKVTLGNNGGLLGLPPSHSLQQPSSQLKHHHQHQHHNQQQPQQPQQQDNGLSRPLLEEQNSAIYELGMYFGDHSLTPYNTGFDLQTAYTPYQIDHQHGALFDDLEVAGEGVTDSSSERNMCHASMEMSPQQYARFQSMPVLGYNSGNSLGLIFDSSACMEEGGVAMGAGVVGGAAENNTVCMSRSNSIDVLGFIGGSGDAAVAAANSLYDMRPFDGCDGTTMNPGKIFSTPAGRETFLTSTPILGHSTSSLLGQHHMNGMLGQNMNALLGSSVPMPKQRSLSVPELPFIPIANGAKTGVQMDGEFLAIHEEEDPRADGDGGGGGGGDDGGGGGGGDGCSHDRSAGLTTMGIKTNNMATMTDEEEDISAGISTGRLRGAKMISGGTVPSASLTAFPGMQSMASLDDFQAYIDGMSAGI